MTERNSLVVSPYSREGSFTQGLCSAIPTSQVYPAAQRAYYHAVRMVRPGTAYRLLWINGSVASTDNVQIGLYLPDGVDGAPGTALVRGNQVLAAGVTKGQYDPAPANTNFGQGPLWVATWCSGITETLFSIAPSIRAYGYYMESGLVSGLPAFATPVQPTTSYVPASGFTTRPNP